LEDIELHHPKIASFKFKTSRPVHILPGQAAILDFSDVVGKRGYSHMARPGQEASLNDDHIRTWTVSSAHPDVRGTDEFTLTIREKEGGIVTPALLSLALSYATESSANPPGLRLPLVGISGDFTLPPRGRKLLWIAGGIGVTPFLSMLSYLSADKNAQDYDIKFALSTRDPEVLLPMIFKAVEGLDQARVKVSLHVFAKRSTKRVTFPSNMQVELHSDRLSKAFLDEIQDLGERQAYLCGPTEFESAVTKALLESGYKVENIKREGFAY